MKKKTFAFLVFFILMAVFQAQAKGIFTPVLTGTVTNANMTITLTAGSADIDFASATIPRNYQGHLLKVCDSTLKCAQGYVYTNGAGNVQNIVSAKGGTTRNWISDSGINTDDAAGYTYTLLHSGATPEVYGITWNESTDAYARIGNTRGVAVGTKPDDSALSIQSQMKRVTLLDNGTVNYNLCATDSTLKEDCATPSVLTGADGQVMVQIPKFWYRYMYSSTIHYWAISPVSLPGFSVHPAFVKDGVEVDYRYIGAYEGVLYDSSITAYVDGIYQTAWSCTFETDDKSILANSRTAPFKYLTVGQKITVSGTASNNATFTVASIVSDTKITVDEALTDETAAATVIQTQKDFTATTGDKLSSISGKTAINQLIRANARVIAANRGTGWRQIDYDLASAIQLLYLTEYASFYSQSMIGAGITNVADWLAYNDYNPIARSGNSNAIGNATGNNAGSTSAATETTKYLSYRGIENWFGHLWKWVDGFNINNNIPYVSNTRANFADDTTTNYTRLTDYLSADVTLINADGYQATLQKMSRGFLPLTVGATSTTKVTDYYYQASGWRVAVLGGSSISGAAAGAFCWALPDSSGTLYRTSTARLSF